MKIKYIYWFANYNLNAPSVRYRGKYPLEYLKEKYKINSSFVYPSYKIGNALNFIFTFLSILFFRRKNSIIVIENIYTKRIYSYLLKFLLLFRKQHTLYDIDDADYERFSPDNLNYFMKTCQTCSAGSQTLINYCKKFNNNTFLLTSPIIIHDFVKTKRNEILTIGWIGYFSAHKTSMYNNFLPSLKMITFPIKLILLGVNKKEYEIEIRDYYSTNLNILIEIPENINWYDELNIYKKIMTFDIGISTLTDNELNRAKSAFKLKQYMSCAVPVLANNIGENTYFLEEGYNGYFCNNSEEFKNKIIYINELDDSEYLKLSINARKSYNNFDMNHYCNSLLKYYENFPN